MNKFNSEINNNGFFFINKQIIWDGTWAKLSQAGKAVLPVLIKHRNPKGIAFPSRQTIGMFSGLSENAVRLGIKSIKENLDVKVKKIYRANGYYNCEYHIPTSIVEEKDNGKIRINNTMIALGVWRMLNPSGKSLYMVLRTFAEHDQDDFAENCEDVDNDEFRAWYAARKYDIVKFESKSGLAELAGISRQSVGSAVKSLRKIKLLEDIEQDDQTQQKIYISPQIYNRDFFIANAGKRDHKQKTL